MRREGELIDQVEAERAGRKRGIVIFDSRYGNTERIAVSFEVGLKQAGLQTICRNANEIVDPKLLKEYDLIAVGAPTEKLTASQSIKEFFEMLRETRDLGGRFGFAFDTRFAFPLSGSAAKFIEKELKRLGLDIIMSHSSAIVVSQKEEKGGVKLKEGEEKRFEEIGLQVGKALAAKREVIAE